jgi:hypothetical protein
MKLRPINIFEIVLAILFITGHVLLACMHIPIMGLVTVLSGGILCILYFYLGFITLKSPDVAVVSSILYGVVFGVAVIGLLFTFQHWPYAIFEITVGLILFIVLAVIRLLAVYVFKRPTVLQRSQGITIRYIVLFVLLLYALITLKFS